MLVCVKSVVSTSLSFSKITLNLSSFGFVFIKTAGCFSISFNKNFKNDTVRFKRSWSFFNFEKYFPIIIHLLQYISCFQSTIVISKIGKKAVRKPSCCGNATRLSAIGQSSIYIPGTRTFEGGFRSWSEVRGRLSGWRSWPRGSSAAPTW